MVCRKQTLMRLSHWLLLLTVSATTAMAQTLPQQASDRHEGVASCATSVCHGKVSPDPASTVWLNEYRIWLRQDFHSRAYRTLQTAQSQAIAAKLGLASAHTADICLDCHADNVPAEKRGRRFQISDGVACEACHGGSGRWLESHAEKGTTHSDNIKAGMYPTEQPLARAQLCLSCHLGTRDKFATHKIMGAGHPRLSFELETFTANQPMHFEVDEDYRARKPAIARVNMWLTGLLVSARDTVVLLQSERFTAAFPMPEPAFYQCHACHHSMDDLRWAREGGTQALPPGSIRLNDASLQLLTIALEVLQPEQALQLSSAVNALHQGSVRSHSLVLAEAAKLERFLNQLAVPLSSGRYSNDQLRSLRLALLMAAGDGNFRHFTAAEQAFMAVETLSISLADEKRYQQILDAWFETMKDENSFVPKQYALFARKLQDAL